MVGPPSDLRNQVAAFYMVKPPADYCNQRAVFLWSFKLQIHFEIGG